MRRRQFIGLVCGAAAFWPTAWPVDLQAQQVRTIGFMHIASAGAMSHLVISFRQGLKEFGLEPADVPIEFRWADGRYDRLKAFAEDLVARRVALIVTGGGNGPALAAKAATSTIPIVFNIGDDPVKVGLVASLSRPGGNATGVNILTLELATKRLGLLHDLLPKGAALGYLVNPKTSASTGVARTVIEAAQAMGREIVPLEASSEAEIDAAFATIPQHRLGGLLVAADPFFHARREQLVQWTARLGLAACFEQREFAWRAG